jgi:hypothetical protein
VSVLIRPRALVVNPPGSQLRELRKVLLNRFSTRDNLDDTVAISADHFDQHRVGIANCVCYPTASVPKDTDNRPGSANHIGDSTHRRGSPALPGAARMAKPILDIAPFVGFPGPPDS